MLIGEPPRTQADLNFTLFGFPVRVHPLFWLVALVLGMKLGNAADVLTWVVAVFVSILFHELGHATAMRAYGYRPWITLYGMGGLASYGERDAYGARSSPREHVLISLAGPGAGFLLAALICAAVLLTGHRMDFALGGSYGIDVNILELVGSARFTWFLQIMLFINILWGLVNLLPVYPLDGGQVAREILLYRNPGEGIRQSLMLSIATAVLLAVYGLRVDLFITLLFGYLAYMSYTTLRAYGGQRPW